MPSKVSISAAAAMEADLGHGGFGLGAVITLLAAAVLAVPLFKRAGLGSVLGYLAAGLLIGPFGLKLFTDTASILHVAELGVVMFLFIIGLEMQPSRLWAMKGEIFGLGLAQVLLCMGLLTGVGLGLGYSAEQSFIAGTGFVLTSTAIVMQMLDERRTLGLPTGRRIVAILLLEDLTIVPLLAIVAFMAPGANEISLADRLTSIAIGIAAIAGLIAAGRWLLDPMFRLLAKARAREVMTAAALLVVLGAAQAMQAVGLSMAMGAFLAGVLLSESSYRHEMEADIEPFRGVLLGLFFLGVGMALDLGVVAENWRLIAMSVAAYMVLKMIATYAVARAFRASSREAIERAVLMAQGGEFAFVLYAAATQVGVIDARANATLTATVIVSMVLTPILTVLHDRMQRANVQAVDGVDTVEDLHAGVLIIGFGRFGQIASQPLLAHGCSISLIDTNAESIREIADFGFKVYYGDGTRLDILHAAGAPRAQLIIIAVDDRETTLKIAEIVRAEFPQVPILARAFDREHAVELIHTGVNYHIRETFESALTLGRHALTVLDVTEERITDIIADVRRRDAKRLDIEAADGRYAALELIHGNAPISRRGRS